MSWTVLITISFIDLLSGAVLLFSGLGSSKCTCLCVDLEGWLFLHGLWFVFSLGVVLWYLGG